MSETLPGLPGGLGPIEEVANTSMQYADNMKTPEMSANDAYHMFSSPRYESRSATFQQGSTEGKSSLPYGV